MIRNQLTEKQKSERIHTDGKTKVEKCMQLIQEKYDLEEKKSENIYLRMDSSLKYLKNENLDTWDAI